MDDFVFVNIRVREEVDRVLGQRTEITHQDMNDLKYCSAVFKEAMVRDFE